MAKSSEDDIFLRQEKDASHLKLHLSGKIIILGIGNRLRSDDAAGSVLAERLQKIAGLICFDSQGSPENYLGKIIKEKPDNIVILDAADFGGEPGDFRVFEPQDFQTANFFSTHNASISLTINYLQSNLSADIIILAIQPKDIAFGDTLSPEVEKSIAVLESWFSRLANNP